MDGREAEAEEALVLVREEVERFETWLASLDVVPTISALRRRADEVVEQVLRENESRWESLSEADRERVEVLARAVVNRLLHEPTLRLRAAAGEGVSTATCTPCASCSGSRPPWPPQRGSACRRVASLDARRQRRGR